jgi:hypothetical protein
MTNLRHQPPFAKPVIPGLPVRAEPGIQEVFGLLSGFRVPLRGAGMTR